MKKIFTLIFSIFSVGLFAQEAEEIDFSQLSSPSIPAFTILGVQPSEISRPKTLDALETSVYSNFSKDGNIALPKNYALEFTPYWLKAKPRIEFNDYVNPNAGQSFLQNSAFSLASYEQKSYKDTTKNNVRMGIGYRTVINKTKFIESDEYVNVLLQLQAGLGSASLLQGNLSALQYKSKKLQDSTSLVYNKIINDSTIRYSFEKYVERAKQQAKNAEEKILIDKLAKELVYKVIDENKGKDGKIILEQIEEKFKTGVNEFTKSKELTDSLQKIIDERYGFSLEFAAALTLDFPTNDIYFSEVPKFGIWITPSYRLKGEKVKWLHNFELLAVGRYIKNYLPNNYSDNFDVGGKIVFETGRFSINGELLQRFQKVTISSETVNNVTTKTTESTQDFKATLNLNYALTPNMVLSYSFGKNYELNTGSKDNLISMLSINYALGKMSKNSLKENEEEEKK